ncbi:hypothetical protein SAMN05444359_12683 [Neolewinella agarilytica]|uniref:Uncharacterized protein n=1 Tax=Neolewinella agarilytica TaxID=478744 RepID=A0A1H9M232_9BACT|nr:hypothetical protein SAMN05444359_12683 [Neolewinella agarilytica]
MIYENTQYPIPNTQYPIPNTLTSIYFKVAVLMVFAVCSYACEDGLVSLNSESKEVKLSSLDLNALSDELAKDNDLQLIFEKIIEVQVLMADNSQISDMSAFSESFGGDKKAFFKGLSKHYETLDYEYLVNLDLELEGAQTRLKSKFKKEFNFLRESDIKFRDAFTADIQRKFAYFYSENTFVTKSGNCADALCNGNHRCRRMLWCLVRTSLCGFLDNCVDTANAWTVTIISAGFIGMNPIGISAGVVGGIIYNGWAIDDCQRQNEGKCHSCESECEL